MKRTPHPQLTAIAALVVCCSTQLISAATAGSSKDGWKPIFASGFDRSGGSLEPSGNHLYHVKPGSWTQYEKVDLHDDTKAVQMNVANGGSDSKIEILIGDKKAGTLTVPNTGGWGDYERLSMVLNGSRSGVHNVKLNFVDGNVNIDEFRFGETVASLTEKETAPSNPQSKDPAPPIVRLNSEGGGFKPRVIHTTDLGADPDDEQSMVRQLVSANEFDIEGLIVATGCWKKSQGNTAMLDKLVDAYGEAVKNLSVHADGYPSYEYLKSISVMGQTGYGMSDVGEGKDSPGSEMIIAAVDKDDPRPLWVTGWGGMNTIAQAVWKARATRSPEEFKVFLGKLRCFDILGQDDSGAWLAKNFPELFYIRAVGVYGWAPSDNYLDEHIQNHGPLGALYPDRKWATEGDTPAFMHIYPNGLNDPDQIDQGGWGGRFDWKKQKGIRSMSEVHKIDKNGEPKFDPYFMFGNTPEKAKAISRWSKGYNNNFQARMDWSITSKYEDANHHPVAIVDGDKTRKVLARTVAPGASIRLSAKGSSDPDGDGLAYKWSFYKDAGSYQGEVSIEGADSAEPTVKIPADAAGKNIHVILELYDDGTPNLYAYRRIVFTGAGQAANANP